MGASEAALNFDCYMFAVCSSYGRNSLAELMQKMLFSTFLWGRRLNPADLWMSFLDWNSNCIP